MYCYKVTLTHYSFNMQKHSVGFLKNACLVRSGYLLLMIITVGACRTIDEIPVEVLNEKYDVPPSNYIQVDSLAVHYRDEGPKSDSVPLVLLHGTGSSLYTWDAWAGSLKEKHRIIRLDLPAFGLTGPHPEGTYTLDFYVEFLHDFLQQLDVNRCVLAGNSLGGEITWQYALRYPDEVKKMILIGAAGYPTKSKNVPLPFVLLRMPVLREAFKKNTPEKVIRKSLNYLYADTTRITDSLVSLYFDMTHRSGNREALTERMESIGEEGPWKQIPTIQTPTLLLWGAEDKLIPPEYGRRFDRDLPNSTLVLIPDAGHMPMEELPQRTLTAVRKFLD
jgi:pimeloyl-ACP methyl ester carboxylesterase